MRANVSAGYGCITNVLRLQGKKGGHVLSHKTSVGQKPSLAPSSGLGSGLHMAIV